MKDIFVFSSVGSSGLPINYRNSVFKSWEIDKSDAGCVIFEQTKNSKIFPKYFSKILFKKGYKFPNLFYFLNKYPNILNEYKYISVMDDDLYFETPNTFKYLVKYMNQYELSVASPSNGLRGKSSYYSIMNKSHPSDVCFITNFCEMGAMILEASFCKILQDYYYENNITILDFGFDILISSLANKLSLNIGIIQNLNYFNPYQKKRDVCRYDYLKSKLKHIEPKLLDTKWLDVEN